MVLAVPLSPINCTFSLIFVGLKRTICGKVYDIYRYTVPRCTHTDNIYSPASLDNRRERELGEIPQTIFYILRSRYDFSLASIIPEKP